jgi:putative SOS response-associated peptidase YedK
MCGRYNFTVEQSEEIKDILEKLNSKYNNASYKTGEIRPTDQAPILISSEQELSPVVGSWGFPKFDGKGVIINARAETAFEKKTFRESLVSRRCIIPSTGFYEWDDKKQKFLFRIDGSSVLYMAGIYNLYAGSLRYTILTTNANESIRDIHDRMPLVIPKGNIEAWIMDQHSTNDLLRREPPQLLKQAVNK